MKFDGKAFAYEIEEQVRLKVESLVKTPKIVSVLVGGDPASILYTNLKKRSAERVGIEFEIMRVGNSENLRELVKKIGERDDVTGLMVQLPIPGLQGQALQDVLSTIPTEKDVDGLRYPESTVVPPVVKAVLLILDKIATSIIKTGKYVVIGASGFVGSALCIELQKRGVEPIKVESNTDDPTRFVLKGDVVISCVGRDGVVKGEMVKPGSIVVDVGAPYGDMMQEVYQKASVSVEVPGGVGPVTIACLMQNACDRIDLDK